MPKVDRYIHYTIQGKMFVEKLPSDCVHFLINTVEDLNNALTLLQESGEANITELEIK
jgi:hypothetical protein